METFFNILRKGIVLTMMVVFAVVFTYVPQYFTKSAPVAEAVWPVMEVGLNLVMNTTTAFNETLASTKEFGLDTLAFMIAKAILSAIIGSLIKWINSGFKGKPAFVQDFKRLVLDAADKAAGAYLKKLGGIGSFICSPFQLDIQVALALEYQQAREHAEEGEESECRISGVVKNLENFYKGTFSESSLEDFITITSNPRKYTPYGQLLTARTNMRVKLANEKGEVLYEANLGQGFLSGKVCQMIEGKNGKTEDCKITKPGKALQDALSFNLDSGRQSLVQADEINELITALLSQLANQAIIGTAGLLGLTPNTGYTSPGFSGGSYVDATVDASRATASSSTNLNVPTTPGIDVSALAPVKNDPLGFSAETFQTSIGVQQSTIAAADSAIPALLAYANDRNNPTDKRNQARAAYNDAIATRNEAIRDQARINTILTRYQTLERTGNDFVTRVDNYATIEEANALYVEFQGLNAITSSQLQSKTASWRLPS
ncbi:MAG: hypothetical protein RLZZ480_494 [Candidatus Parcubacteria bacterium]|jgi:hypothetical protein